MGYGVHKGGCGLVCTVQLYIYRREGREVHKGGRGVNNERGAEVCTQGVHLRTYYANPLQEFGRRSHHL